TFSVGDGYVRDDGRSKEHRPRRSRICAHCRDSKITRRAGRVTSTYACFKCGMQCPPEINYRPAAGCNPHCPDCRASSSNVLRGFYEMDAGVLVIDPDESLKIAKGNRRRLATEALRYRTASFATSGSTRHEIIEATGWGRDRVSRYIDNAPADPPIEFPAAT